MEIFGIINMFTRGERKGGDDVNQTFGEFLREKRLERKLVLRKLATEIRVSPSLLSDIENGEKNAPSDEILKGITNVLEMNKEETEKLYDLAAETKNGLQVPVDIKESVMSNNTIKIALRVAKDFDATDEEWEDFMRRLKNRN